MKAEAEFFQANQFGPGAKWLTGRSGWKLVTAGEGAAGQGHQPA